jgi:hypothetical protein
MLANLQRVTCSNYCPQGHCPNGQERWTEGSDADHDAPESAFPDNPESVVAASPLILDQDEPNRNIPADSVRGVRANYGGRQAWTEIIVGT